MKKTLLITAGLLLGLIMITLIAQGTFSSVVTPATTPTDFPVSSPEVSVNYETLTQNPNTVQVGAGMYNFNEVATNPNPNLGFSFLYSESDDSIYISIDALPLSETRERASVYLADLLGITNEVACTLKVYVGVPYDVDANLSGRNLGLSFCPDAIKL